jgi:hypothetical protein
MIDFHHTAPALDLQSLTDGYRYIDPTHEHKSIYFDNKAFMLTMNNFRLYVDRYEEFVLEYNATVVDIHNDKVDAYLKEHGISFTNQKFMDDFKKNEFNRPQGGKIESRISEAEWKLMPYSMELWKTHKPRNTYEFNNKVQQFCEDRGYTIYMKKAHGMQPSVESTFSAILRAYMQQIYTMNGTAKGEDPTPITKAVINARFLSKSTFSNGATGHKVGVKAVRAHCKRFEEAGILVETNFHGSKRPKTAYVSPLIMVAYLPNIAQNALTENQLVTTTMTTKGPDKDVSTFPLDTIKIGNVKNISEKDCVSGLADSFNIHTSSQVAKKINAPAAKKESQARKNPNQPRKLSRNEQKSVKRIASILKTSDLVKELNDGKHYDHVPLNRHDLHEELSTGVMSKEQMMLYVVQDLVKYASQLYKNQTVFDGTWANAIDLITRFFYTVSDGKPHRKSKIVQLHEDYIHVITSQVEQNNSNPLRIWQSPFPSLYFDPLATEYKTNSFMVMMNTCRKKLRTNASKLKRDKKRQLDKLERINRSNEQSKLVVMIKKQIKGAITMQELLSYINQNMGNYWKDPKNYNPLLSRINSSMAKKRKKQLETVNA